MSNSIPTLEELLERLSTDKTGGQDALLTLCLRVGSGERNPIDPPLPKYVVAFACQALAILSTHVQKEKVQCQIPTPNTSKHTLG